MYLFSIPFNNLVVSFVSRALFACNTLLYFCVNATNLPSNDTVSRAKALLGCLTNKCINRL